MLQLLKERLIELKYLVCANYELSINLQSNK
jgi:hypothetical protein